MLPLLDGVTATGKPKCITGMKRLIEEGKQISWCARIGLDASNMNALQIRFNTDMWLDALQTWVIESA